MIMVVIVVVTVVVMVVLRSGEGEHRRKRWNRGDIDRWRGQYLHGKFKHLLPKTITGRRWRSGDPDEEEQVN